MSKIFFQAKLGNEISAPYEVPQLPIEQLESKLLNVRKTSVCPTVFSANNQIDDDLNHDEDDHPDFVPHFQRVNISGEDITGRERHIKDQRIISYFSLQDILQKSCS